MGFVWNLTVLYNIFISMWLFYRYFISSFCINWGSKTKQKSILGEFFQKITYKQSWPVNANTITFSPAYILDTLEHFSHFQIIAFEKNIIRFIILVYLIRYLSFFQGYKSCLKEPWTLPYYNKDEKSIDTQWHSKSRYRETAYLKTVKCISN